MTVRKRIHIIGGGISGLAAGYYLARLASREGLDWSIHGREAAPSLGGIVGTDLIEGCLIERGPDCFSTERPLLLDLCAELGLQNEIIETNPSARGLFLREKQRLHALPPEFCGLTSMKLSTLAALPCLSPAGKIRMAFEWAVPRRRDKAEESMGEFIERRFGKEALARLAQPFLGSIFGSDLRQISLRAVFPHWIMMEEKHGSLTRAFFAAKRNPAAVVSAGFRSLRGGLGMLARSLWEKSGVDWQCDAAVQFIEWGRDKKWRIIYGDGREEESDALFLTVPARIAAAMLRESFPVFAQVLGRQPARSITLVNAIFNRSDWPEKLRGSGIISGLDESYKLQGASFSTFKFEGRSPEDRVLVRLFGSPLWRGLENKNSEEIKASIVDDFCRLAGINAQPLWSRITRYKDALPGYSLDYMQWKQAAEKKSPLLESLYLAGQSYQPGGLAGCIASVQKAVERLAADFKADAESPEERADVHAR